MKVTLFSSALVILLAAAIASCQQITTQSSSPPSITDINQPVPLEVGQSKSLSGTLEPNETIHFILIPKAGQRMSVKLESTGIKAAILDQTGQVIEEKPDLKEWQGSAIYSGQYFVQLTPVQGAEKSQYKITLALAEK